MIEIEELNGAKQYIPLHRVLCITPTIVSGEQAYRLTARSLLNPNDTQTLHISGFRIIPANEIIES